MVLVDLEVERASHPPRKRPDERLAGLAQEMRRRCAGPDTDGDGGLEDRSLDLGVTFGGATLAIRGGSTSPVLIAPSTISLLPPSV